MAEWIEKGNIFLNQIQLKTNRKFYEKKIKRKHNKFKTTCDETVALDIIYGLTSIQTDCNDDLHAICVSFGKAARESIIGLCVLGHLFWKQLYSASTKMIEMFKTAKWLHWVFKA